MDENRFYVYAYLREDGTPYYIGKGSGYRITNRNRCCPSPKDPKRSVKLYDRLSEDEAFSLEMLGIALWGRKDLETGCLRNLTDGGDGTSGRVVSEEHRKRISAAKAGKPISDAHRKKLCESQQRRWSREEERAKMSGREVSEATRIKMSLSHIGKAQSPETVAKRVMKTTGKKRSAEFRALMSSLARSRARARTHLNVIAVRSD